MSEKTNILIVDDDPVILKSAGRILTPEGYNVEGVLSGKKAVQKIRQGRYKIVVTDIMMPGIDGITLIRWIRQYRPSLGVVVITGDLSTDTMEEACGLRILNYIMKPFTPETLRNAVYRALETIQGNASGIEQQEDLQNTKLALSVSEIESEEDIQPGKRAELEKVINQYREKSGNAIWVLWRAQEIFGYLPTVIQKRIALGLNMHPSEIRSIVSFYSGFRTKPKAGHAPGYMSGIERAWNSVSWMTEKRALHAVNDFIKDRQLET